MPMNATLIYDAATMTRTPQNVAILTGLLAAVACALWAWNRWKGAKAGGATIWFTGAAVVMALVAVGSEVERRWIAGHDDVREVQGPVLAVWEQRTRRSGNDWARWQGFTLGGVDFAYVRNTDMNYFNNAGPGTIDLVEGLVLRVRYIEERDGERTVRHIVRVERLG